MPSKPLALLTTTAPQGTVPSLPYARPLEEAGYAVEQRVIVESSSVQQFLSTLRLGARVRRYHLVVANEYSTAIGLGLLALVFRARARLVVLSLNLSRRAFKIGLSPIQRLIDRSLRRYNAIAVHSAPEIASFVALHNLKPAQFRVIPWGFDLPEFDGGVPEDLPSRYVCMIGRNNRDFVTAAEALAGTGIGGVFVGAAPSMQLDNAAIRVFSVLPFTQCLGIMAGALANLILVNDESRGAGHITAVAAMLLERPQIFSDVATLAGYLRDGEHGIGVPLRDPAAVRAAVQRLASDPILAARMGEAGRRHALGEMSHARFLGRIVDVILGNEAASRPGA